MNDTAVISCTDWVVAVQRTESVTKRTFEDVLTIIHSGLGHPNFAEFAVRLSRIVKWDPYRSPVEAEAGSAGLIVFLELDLGSVVHRDPEASNYRSVRIIAGNMVTMESMARSTPAAGALAPITILIFKASNGVHIRYDTVTSALGTELSDEAAPVAADLDNAVLALIAAAAR